MLSGLRNWLEKKSGWTLSAPGPELLALFAGVSPTLSGISVNAESALRVVPVYAAVRIRCETLGSLPLHLYQRQDDGGKDRATSHPLYKLLHDRPNPWTAAADFIMQMEKDTLTHGAGFALANRVNGRIAELIRLPPGTVTVEIDDQTLEPRYRIRLRAGDRIYSWQDILHVPSLDGLAAITQCREAIALYAALERYCAQLFSGGGRPSGVLMVPGKLSPEKSADLGAAWARGHAGEASGRTAVLQEGTKFEPLSFNSVDLQFQEMRVLSAP